MEALQYLCSKFNYSRDLLNYLTLRDAHQGDDSPLGEFLLKVFSLAWCNKNHESVLHPSRIQEILAVGDRRKNGVVRILELGRTIVGSYGLVTPGKSSGAWNSNASYFCAFAIDANMQSLGLAVLLMADAQLKSLAWDLPTMDLKVVKSSKKLHVFYQNLGFERDLQGDCREHEVDLIGFTCQLSQKKIFTMLEELTNLRQAC